MNEVVLDPALWESVEAGAQAHLERWLVAEGDHVQAGQALAQARLLHDQVDVPATHKGIVEQILVAAGEPFQPGSVLARLAPV
jgi:biotin carboxyl carrier protein